MKKKEKFKRIAVSLPSNVNDQLRQMSLKTDVPKSRLLVRSFKKVYLEENDED